METGKPLSKKARTGELSIRGTRAPDQVCDYCAEGLPVSPEGWHNVIDEELQQYARVPCAKRAQP
jgi:hypothetical protein